MSPAAKSGITGCSMTTAYTIIRIDGGITTARPLPPMITPLTTTLWYPRACSSGAPIWVTMLIAAELDPISAPRKASSQFVAIGSPARNPPNRRANASYARALVPLATKIDAIRMNSGNGSSELS